MPVLEIHSPDASPGTEALGRVSRAVTDLLGIEPGHCWLFWRTVPADAAFHPGWAGAGPSAPVVLMVCKSTYPPAVRSALVSLVAEAVAEAASGATTIDPAAVYVAVRPVAPGDLWVRGDVWTGDAAPAPGPTPGDPTDHDDTDHDDTDIDQADHAGTSRAPSAR